MLLSVVPRRCATPRCLAIVLAIGSVSGTAFAQTPLPAPSQETTPAPAPQVSVEAPASAPTPTPESTASDDAVVKGLERFFAEQHAGVPGFRLATTVAAVAVGATSIPAGAVLLDHGQSGAGWVAVGFGAGALLGAAVVWIAPAGPLQPVADTFEKNKAEGLTAARLLEVTERDWREQARKAAAGRRAAAIGMAFLGTAGLVFGAYATTTNTQIASLNPDEQAGWGTLALVAGGSSLVGAAASYFLQTPVEQTYDLYRSVSGRAAPAVARNAPGIHVTPVVGPGAVGLSGTF